MDDTSFKWMDDISSKGWKKHPQMPLNCCRQFFGNPIECDAGSVSNIHLPSSSSYNVITIPIMVDPQSLPYILFSSIARTSLPRHGEQWIRGPWSPTAGCTVPGTYPGLTNTLHSRHGGIFSEGRSPIIPVGIKKTYRFPHGVVTFTC